MPKGAAPGTDFGWPAFEGPGGGGTPPATAHRHTDGWCAITGGYVIRGRYVYGDLCTGKLWSARFTGTTLVDDRPLEAHRALPDLVRPRCPRPRLRGQLQRPRVSAVSSGTSQIAPSGGSVISAENAWLCHGIGSASTPPRLPVSVPP